jgi:hypothetical protein
MAELNFVRGSIKGKVGQFVGSSWKGIDYIKTFTPPSNPRTEGQVAIRDVFQHVASIAKAIYAGVLKPYTFPVPQKMTAYNKMVQINKPMFDDKAWEQAKLKIWKGPLFNPGITAATVENVATPTAAVRVTFSATVGDAGDVAAAVVHDEETETTLYTTATRGAAQIDVPIATLDATALDGLHAYLVFSKPPVAETGESGQVSNTAYLKVPTPTLPVNTPPEPSGETT